MKVRLALVTALVCLVGACAQISGALDGREEADAEQAQVFLPDGGPPVVDGHYELRQPCAAWGCPDMRAPAPLDLYARPYPDAAVIATIPQGEWLRSFDRISRMRPTRGVVQQSIDLVDQADGGVARLEVGDVVYTIDFPIVSDDPGRTLWFRGQRLYDQDFAAVISWDQSGAAEYDASGIWERVRRDNGQVGFARDTGRECFGDRDGMGDCDWAGPPAPPPDCEAYDIDWSCQDLRSRAEPSTASYPTPQPFRDCAECPSMVRIPGRSFAVGQYEVTFAEWDACVAAGGCNGYSPNDQDWGRGNRPAMSVKWDDARAYVRWLSRYTRRRYRLLTTDEWVVAAFPGGRRQNYSWGNDSPVCDLGARNGAAYNRCMPQRTMPVGSFQPNAYGLYDTIGNVGEWLQDRYMPGDGRHAIIGSSWASSEADLGGRGGGWPHDLGPDTGFRVARSR